MLNVILTIFGSLFYLATYVLLMKSLAIYLMQMREIPLQVSFLILALASFLVSLLFVLKIALIKRYRQKQRQALSCGYEPVAFGLDQIVFKVAKGFWEGFRAG